MSDKDDIWRELQSLYSDLKSDGQFPDTKSLLAHYTSIETLECILKNNELWFSNPLFMNDVDELRFGINEGANRFFNSKDIKDSLSEAQFKIVQDQFEQYLNKFTNEYVLDVYAFCLSEHDEINHPDGLLSMWRGYGSNGNGAAVVFDTSKLVSMPSSSLVISRVEYSSRQERLDWLDRKLKEFSLLLMKLKLKDECLYLASYAIFERIKLFSIFTKHHGFAEEREWRVAYLKDRDMDSKFSSMLSYSIGPRGVEPKLKLKLEGMDGHISGSVSLTNLVHQIILGPSVSTPLAKAAFERVLEKIDKPELKSRVWASSIPFRH